jgi:hypothetical protein
MHGGHLRYDMSIPCKSNSASFSKADLASGTESPTKPGVYWFQSRTMARALMVEVRVMNGELTVWWPTENKPVTHLTGCWHGPIPPSSGPGRRVDNRRDEKTGGQEQS